MVQIISCVIPVRLCYSCHCIEDELHLVTAYSKNFVERRMLFSKVADKYPGFDNLDDVGKFVFLLTFEDAQMFTWLGKFLYKSFATKTLQSDEIYIRLDPMSLFYGGLAATPVSGIVNSAAFSDTGADITAVMSACSLRCRDTNTFASMCMCWI